MREAGAGVLTQPTDTQLTSRKYSVAAVFTIMLALLVLMLLGMRYPVVGRNDAIPNFPNTLILIAVVLAVLYSAMNIALTRTGKERGKELAGPAFGYFCLGVLFIGGTLLFFNGFLDRSTPQSHQTFLTHKYIHQMRGTDYVLVVRDWKNPQDTVRLRIDPVTYQRVLPSAPVEVITARGFLGFERVLGVR